MMGWGNKQVLLRSKGIEQGESLPPSAPCGVDYGQGAALWSVALPTASRLRRADTPSLVSKGPKRRKPFTIAVLSRAHSPSQGSTYLSGIVVQTNRATSVFHNSFHMLISDSVRPQTG